MNKFNKKAATLTLCLFYGLLMLFTTTSIKAEGHCNNPNFTEKNYDKRVLFLGNSYTYYNDLPKIFKLLSKSGGYDVLSDSITKSGGSLIYFSDTESILTKTKSKVAATFNEKLKTKWDVIVLQEQSQVPSIPKDCKDEMYPMVRELNTKITKAGAQPMLFMTWGYLDGDKENGYATYEDMQEGLRKGYMGIAQELSLPVSPVGLAFLNAKQKDKNIKLWDDDGSHPSVEGSYLAACVFYDKIFGKSPVNLRYTAGLSKQRAFFLQSVAEETVLNFSK
jgi:hypothetical protein